ncbi:MAG: TIGR00296 family protein [Candidatus Micrarchaeota archaeon]|nr:TIGR00296 family protein [Candidatus Micrarchaeota archaeon]
MKVYPLSDGESLVKAARESIELDLTSPHFKLSAVTQSIKHIRGKHGVFITLQHYPTMELRGCIGFINAVSEISELLPQAAISAAFEDTRFVPVSKRELGELLISVSILTEPQELKGGAKERKRGIHVGTTGLIAQYGHYSGLLLPEVAAENNWDVEQFLQEVCLKAGLHKNYWSQPNVKLFKFETQVFKEETPSGKVIEQEH